MKRAKVKGVDEHLIRLTTELDKSEKIVPNGQVSKGIYLDIFHSRNFDLYGNLMQKIPPLPSRKFLELKYLAEQLGIEFTQTMDLEGIIKQADLEKVTIITSILLYCSIVYI